MTDQQLLEECKNRFDYNKENGLLTNKTHWHASKVGKPAGYICSRLGRRRVNIKGKMYFHYHLIWLIENGELPSDSLDHINRDKTDDRISNLRLANHSENMRNKTACGACKYLGVAKETGRDTYRAMIRIEGKNKYLGSSKDPKEAALMYDSAARKHHGEFANLNFPNEEVEFNKPEKLEKVSRYKYVSLTSCGGRWSTRVHHNKKVYFAGNHETEIEAAKAADKLIRHYGWKKTLNFPLDPNN